MSNTVRKATLLQKRRWRIRKKVTGTALRPRLCVRFTAKHVYAQAIDDDAGATLVFLRQSRCRAAQAEAQGEHRRGENSRGGVCRKAKAAGIASVVFDRSGAPYHGKVKVFADAAREGGLQF